MKSIKDTVSAHRLKAHGLIKAWLQPKLGMVGARYRLPARRRLANVWAKKHPRRTFACTVGALLFLLAGNVALDLCVEDKTSVPDMGGIADMQPLFTAFRNIQAGKETHRQALLELVAKGAAVREELDSMIAIPVKTHADSVRIILRYKQLESIVESLNNNDNP